VPFRVLAMTGQSRHAAACPRRHRSERPLMKKLAILGSTGSIGTNVLEIVSLHPDRFRVVALAGGGTLARMEQQVRQFQPDLVAVRDREAALQLGERFSSGGIRFLSGPQGLEDVASHPDADMVVSALVGSVGLMPTLRAVRSRKHLAIANKEALVMAGEFLMREARENGISVLPIDSEHSAIFQSLAGHRREDVRRLILTASGGPFLKTPLSELAAVTPEQALNHPQWRMGKKVSIDSATLMNKGLEVIEARWLFSVPADKIEVQIHPQSILHSMVEYIDGSVVAQMALPDMRGPIAYALSYPERLPSQLPSLNFAEIPHLTFGRVDRDKFPALALAYEALAAGKTYPTVLNAANEVAVEAFLQGRLSFLGIPRLIREILDRHRPAAQHSIEDIFSAHTWARKEAHTRVNRGVS
jgi:1-deoxy-D-xylulose-5-phosphate reductoisomerase